MIDKKTYISTGESRRNNAKKMIGILKDRLIKLSKERQELNKEEEKLLSDLDMYAFLSVK